MHDQVWRGALAMRNQYKKTKSCKTLSYISSCGAVCFLDLGGEGHLSSFISASLQRQIVPPGKTGNEALVFQILDHKFIDLDLVHLLGNYLVSPTETVY